MSLTRVIAGILLVSGVTTAEETSEEKDIFLSHKDAGDKASSWRGALILSTYLYTEEAGEFQLDGGGTSVGSASPNRVYFGELRSKLYGKNVWGDGTVRADLRARLRPEIICDARKDLRCPARNGAGDPTAGTRTGNQYAIHELNGRFSAGKGQLTIGRSILEEIGGYKIDGLRYDHPTSKEKTVSIAAGLFPARGSRSVTTDYPRSAPDAQNIQRPFPIFGSVSMIYGGDGFNASVSAGAILPMGDEPYLDGDELVLRKAPVRIFAASRGYWRYSNKLDLYEYAVLDAIGPLGAGVSNLSLGAHYKAFPTLRLILEGHRVDTDTLTTQALNQLEVARPGLNIVQNNIRTVRLAQNTAKLGLSKSLYARRFELSGFAEYRYRPEFDLIEPNGEPYTGGATLPARSHVELRGQVVDREFFGKTRLSAEASYFFNVGEGPLNRKKSVLYSLRAEHPFKKGDATLDARGYFQKTLEDTQLECAGGVIECFGNAGSSVYGMDTWIYYRVHQDWYGLLGGGLSVATFRARDAGEVVTQPTVFALSAFLQIARRF